MIETAAPYDEFTRFTPDWLLRWLADGALGVLYWLPSTLALAVYGAFCFLLIDRIVSAVDHAIGKRLAARSVQSGQGIGALGARRTLLFGRIPGWALKGWIGLPMWAVMQLALTSDADGARDLGRLATGYAWQAKTIAALPVAGFWSLQSKGGVELGFQLLLLTAFGVYSYYYWSRGFATTRSVRKVSDALLQLVQKPGGVPPTLVEAMQTLEQRGWRPEAIRSAGWFLEMVNLRIMRENVVFDQITPEGYGMYRAAGAVFGSPVLAAIHPMVGALYVGSEAKSLTEAAETARSYRKHLANLPPELQQLAPAGLTLGRNSMMLIVAALCGAAAAILAWIITGFDSHTLLAAFLYSLIAMFLASLALPAKEQAVKKRISVWERLVGLLAVFGILSLAAKPYAQLWSNSSGLAARALLSWFAILGLMLVWLPTQAAEVGSRGSQELP